MGWVPLIGLQTKHYINRLPISHLLTVTLRNTGKMPALLLQHWGCGSPAALSAPQHWTPMP